VAAGYQVAFLAPTELLAEQHFAGVGGWLRDRSVALRLLTGSLPPAERDALEVELAAGRPALVFGTHALFSERTVFGRLGLVIIDEQHRFGVEQRLELVRKATAAHPHVLHMTATPIPRTLTYTVFGDLDLAVLRQRPPGRRPVRAFFLAGAGGWRRIQAVLTRRIARGQLALVVCPKVGADGSKGGAVRLHAELARRFAAGLVHGRMDVAERQATIAAFRAREFDVLVGTTVLEVGIDVPDATLMVVVGADRFGLSTLHQLRGRVGRGRRRGLCILTGEPGPRLAAICTTTDGFELAERDLALRGAGELLGTRQSGLSDLRALDPVRDIELLSRVREAVRGEEAS
jgi:ATP-dependent DNA helicase RecG